jgi:hypothetical protein
LGGRPSVLSRRCVLPAPPAVADGATGTGCRKIMVTVTLESSTKAPNHSMV